MKTSTFGNRPLPRFPMALGSALVLAMVLGPRAASVAAADSPQKGKPLLLPDGLGGIGLDDMRYSRELGRLLVPAGRTGALDLIDPAKDTIEQIRGFFKAPAGPKAHGQGITSADFGEGYIFTTDRTSRTLNVIDAQTKEVVAKAPLASGPDYVRFVAPTHEVWVTEPHSNKLELFSVSTGNPPVVKSAGLIEVKDGPESLEIDAKRGVAWTNLEKKGTTTSIDLKTHALGKAWPTGCEESSGLALDSERGFLMVGGGDEGAASVLDLDHDGKILSTVKAGRHVDIIAYDSNKSHLYVPASRSASMAILGVSAKGELTQLGTVPTSEGAHCVATDGKGKLFVCDPKAGRLLEFTDDFPTSR